MRAPVLRTITRLSAHALAGYTCGVKNAVGWLRDDSRRVLHQDAATFFEKTAEISHFEDLRDRLRLTLTLGDEALLNLGPDIGSVYEFGGILGLASTELVDHDFVASVMIQWLDGDDVSFWDVYSPYPDDADYWNQGLVKDVWGEKAMYTYTELRPYELRNELAFDKLLSHLATLQARRPVSIRIKRSGNQIDKAIMAALEASPEILM